MLREDTKPWYRQFWPWFIIALPASAVVGGLTTLWISMQTTDSLVLRSDEGIQILVERRIGAEQLAAELQLAALVDIDLDSGAITTTIRAGRLDPAPAMLQLEFSHPAFADRDQFLELSRAPDDAAGNPVWSGHFVRIPGGRWYVSLTSNAGWRLSGEWQGESQITLRPAEAAHAGDR